MNLITERVEQVLCLKCGAPVSTAGLAPFAGVTCTQCGHKMAVPARLANLLLLKPIGKGAMGVVYRAQDTSLRRPVAVKVLKKEENQEERQQARLVLAEARALAALNHPNVVHVFSIGMWREQPYIVMELVDGGRFDKMFERDRPCDEVTCLQVGLDVAEGLNAALHAGLLHGDVKPANILISQDGVAKIIDFGIARRVDDESGHGFIGTPYYVAPEIVQGHRLDFRCDIYSLGATLFNALTGQRPFTGKTVQDIINARLHATPPNVRQVVPSLGPLTADLVQRLTATDPAHRPQSYADVVGLLRQALGAARAGPHPPPTAPSPHDSMDLDAFVGPPSAADTVRMGVESALGQASLASGRSSTRSRSARRGKPARPTSLLAAGIVGGTLAVLGVVLAIVLATSTSGPSVPRGRLEDSFDAPVIDPAWRLVGNTKTLPGSLQFEVREPGESAGLQRQLPVGDAQVELRFDGLQWNPDGKAELLINLTHAGGADLTLTIEKSGVALPQATVSSSGQTLAQRKLASDPRQIVVRFVVGKAGLARVDLGADSQAPSPMDLGAATLQGAGGPRSLEVLLRAIRGSGRMAASLEHFHYQPGLPE